MFTSKDLYTNCDIIIMVLNMNGNWDRYPNSYEFFQRLSGIPDGTDCFPISCIDILLHAIFLRDDSTASRPIGYRNPVSNMYVYWYLIGTRYCVF